MVRSSPYVRRAVIAVALVLVLAPGAAAHAATSIDGPIDLGTAGPFAVLAASTVTNTGLSVLDGDVGLSPGTSITGFPPAVVNGTMHPTDAVAAQAQVDLTTAYGVAAGLTPVQTGLGDLTGLSLTPGVYSGGELSVTGELILAGSAQSVWVFQAASTLEIGSSGRVIVTGGASACNVFWQVGSSATLQPGAQLVGTVMADESVTAKTAATVTGRLLARTAAVTLDTNVISTPTGCDTPVGTVTSSPQVTSAAPPEGQVATDYAHTITTGGSPAPTFTVSGGQLPPGLELDAASGLITGRPNLPGAFDVEITVSNGIAPDAVVAYTIVIAATSVVPPTHDSPATPTLAFSGTDLGIAPLLGVVLLGAGVILALVRPRLRARSTDAPDSSPPIR